MATLTWLNYSAIFRKNDCIVLIVEVFVLLRKEQDKDPRNVTCVLKLVNQNVLFYIKTFKLLNDKF